MRNQEELLTKWDSLSYEISSAILMLEHRGQVLKASEAIALANLLRDVRMVLTQGRLF